MQIGQSSSLSLKSVDYIYVLFSSGAGVWQAWSANYGRNSILLAVTMSLPFAVASYAYALFRSTTSADAQRPDWKRVLILWAGMPLCMVVFTLTALAEVGIMRGIGFGIDNLPFVSLRILIGAGAACFAWAICLLAWSRQRSLRLLRSRIPVVSATLFVGVLSAYGLSELILRNLHKDLFVLLTSIVVTTISALILVILRRAGGPGLERF
jgi:hypothetical protein